MTTKTKGDSLAKLREIMGACLVLDEGQLSSASFDGLKIEGRSDAKYFVSHPSFPHP